MSISIDGVPLAEIEAQIAGKLVQLASQGNAAAANAVLKLTERLREQCAHEQHMQTMASVASDPVALARYLGELGVDADTLREHIGGKLSRALKAAFIAGHRARALEAHALQRARTRSGAAAPPRWMLDDVPTLDDLD